MNKVSIGFSKPKKWKPLAKLIMLIGRTPYSHTFNSWRANEINRRKVFEAVGSGLRILSNKTFKEQALIVELYQIEATDDQVIEIEQIAHDIAGTGYGYAALVGIGIMKIFNFFNKLFKLKGKQRNPFKDGNKSNVCIEASARQFCKIANIPLPTDIESYDLLRYRNLVKKHAKRVPQSKVDKINGTNRKKK